MADMVEEGNIPQNSTYSGFRPSSRGPMAYVPEGNSPQPVALRGFTERPRQRREAKRRVDLGKQAPPAEHLRESQSFED